MKNSVPVIIQALEQERRRTIEEVIAKLNSAIDANEHMKGSLPLSEHPRSDGWTGGLRSFLATLKGKL